jgi:catechol 2,3-dioxygenase-like lactoylglutathione lyase family enzyme
VFDHVTIRVADREASEQFYATVLAAIGVDQAYSLDWLAKWAEFSLSPADGDHPVTRGLHVGFGVPSREDVEAFWRAGVDAGYRDDGEPGPRPEYGPDYYGGFLLDPDGNSAEAVHNPPMREKSAIDHVWVRVADVAASRRFYELIAPVAGLSVEEDTPDKVRFSGFGATLSLVAGTPTEHVHIAFPAATNDVVDDFHRLATEAGYRDNGPPGERPGYHEGYYAAFVLDPDGNNIELVNHNRA